MLARVEYLAENGDWIPLDRLDKIPRNASEVADWIKKISVDSAITNIRFRIHVWN